MWIALRLDIDAARAEALSDALLEAGAISATLEDADAGTDRETPQFDEPGEGAPALWPSSRLVALFPETADVEAALEHAASVAGLGQAPAHETEIVDDQDWVRLTQSQFDPIRVNDRLWIVPSWHAPPDPHVLAIILDPGLAFGTGSHPTTRLCLDWLCAHVKGGERILDYGCGSGILAVAAAKLGARRVVAVDIDEAALSAAAENAARNAVAIDLRHSREPLDERFDLVVANILTKPLVLLAPLLSGRLPPGGRIALTGILAEQSSEVIAAYAPWIPLRVTATNEGWVRLEGSRP